MNIFHYTLISLAILSFIINLYKNGDKKIEKQQYYNAIDSFWSSIILIILTILSTWYGNKF